jgi:TniQ
MRTNSIRSAISPFMVSALKFPVPTTPINDESLMGFVARACDRNGYPYIRHALQLAGSSADRASFVARDTEADFRRLSEFFGCSEEAWRCRVHGKIAKMRGFSDFFGIPLRQYFREPKIRRLSPAALHESPHHRAIWQIKPLHYCPKTGELLISRCPNPKCERTLTWNTTYGVQHCEFCIGADAEPFVDLRSLQPPKLVGEDLKIYSTVADLVDPSVGNDAVVNPGLPGWPRWEIFDMIVLIAVIMSKRFIDRARLKKVDAFLLPDWHANFMLACRAVLDWPKGFHDVIEVMRKGAEEREGYWGMKKEIGDLGFNLQTRYGATVRMCVEIDQQIDSFFAAKGRTTRRSYAAVEGSKEEWISFKGALKKYGSAPFLHSLIEHREAGLLRVENAKRAPVYFKKSELDALMKARKSLINLDRFHHKTGFTQSVIQGLVHSGHIRLASGAIARFREPSVVPAEITRFERQLSDKASVPVPGQVPLLFALMEKGASEHLLQITRRCLDGDFHYSLAPRGENILSRIMVLDQDIRRPKIQLDPSIVFPEKMTMGDIEIMLDIAEGDIAGLLETKSLKRAFPGRNRYLDGRSVHRLANKYISHRCLARRLKLNVRALKGHMASMGVRPAVAYLTANKTPGYLWKRSRITEILGI